MAKKKNLENFNKTKHSIIMATIEIMVKQSVSNFKLTDVSDSLGMTKAAIYWYFPSKEILIEEVADFLYQTYVDYAQEIVTENLNPYEKLKKLIIGREDDIDSALMCAFPIKFFLEYYAENSKLKRMVQKGYEQYNKSIFDIISEGIEHGYFNTKFNIYELTTLISGAIDGLSIQNLLLSSETIQVPRTIIFSVIEEILNVDSNQFQLITEE